MVALSEAAALEASACAGVVACGGIVVIDPMPEIAIKCVPHLMVLCSGQDLMRGAHFGADQVSPPTGLTVS